MKRVVTLAVFLVVSFTVGIGSAFAWDFSFLGDWFKNFKISMGKNETDESIVVRKRPEDLFCGRPVRMAECSSGRCEAGSDGPLTAGRLNRGCIGGVWRLAEDILCDADMEEVPGLKTHDACFMMICDSSVDPNEALGEMNVEMAGRGGRPMREVATLATSRGRGMTIFSACAGEGGASCEEEGVGVESTDPFYDPRRGSGSKGSSPMRNSGKRATTVAGACNGAYCIGYVVEYHNDGSVKRVDFWGHDDPENIPGRSRSTEWVNENDSDGDRVIDTIEQEAGTDPEDPNDYNENDVDSDYDGLADGEESQLGSDPNNMDSDGDGHVDGTEVFHNTDPTDKNEHPEDDDSNDDETYCPEGVDKPSCRPNRDEVVPEFLVIYGDFTLPGEKQREKITESKKDRYINPGEGSEEDKSALSRPRSPFRYCDPMMKNTDPSPLGGGWQPRECSNTYLPGGYQLDPCTGQISRHRAGAGARPKTGKKDDRGDRDPSPEEDFETSPKPKEKKVQGGPGPPPRTKRK